jgi:hypothetical protein
MTGGLQTETIPRPELRFEGRFRRYQKSMLDLAAEHPSSDRRYHRP